MTQEMSQGEDRRRRKVIVTSSNDKGGSWARLHKVVAVY